MYEISVIIPVFNQENYLKECLDSLVNQTIGIDNIEVILVNDKSTDNSLAILEEYASKYSSFKIINHKENKGAGTAKNTGMSNVSSDYVTFLDSDDFIDKDYVKDSLNLIKENNCDLLISNWEIYPLDENSVHKPHIDENNVIHSVSEKPLLVFSTPAWSKIFHKNLYKFLNFSSNRSYDDNIVSVESLLNSNKIFLSKNEGYYYRKNLDSITKDITIDNPLNLSNSIKELFKLVENYPNEGKYIKLLILKFMDDVLFWLYNYEWLPTEELEIVERLQDAVVDISQEDIDFLNCLSSFKLLYPEDILNINNYSSETFLAKYKYYLKSSKVNPIASVYIDTGNGFNEQEKVSINYNLSNLNDLTFDLSNYSNIKSLRFDPIEGEFITSKIIKTTPITNRTDSNSYNSLVDEHQTFFTLDPSYILEGDFENIKNINIQFELNILNNKDLSEILLNGNFEDNPKQNVDKSFLKKLWG